MLTVIKINCKVSLRIGRRRVHWLTPIYKTNESCWLSLTYIYKTPLVCRVSFAHTLLLAKIPNGTKQSDFFTVFEFSEVHPSCSC